MTVCLLLILYQVWVTICDSCVNFLSLAALEEVEAMMRYLRELAQLATGVEKVRLVWRSKLLS